MELKENLMWILVHIALMMIVLKIFIEKTCLILCLIKNSTLANEFYM